MKATVKYAATLATLAFAVLGGASAHAASFDVAFYELTEEVTFVFDENGFVSRNGAGSLAGEAALGSPLCPAPIVMALVHLGFMNASSPCYVTATGSDVITAAGGGTVEATIHVKVQGDNPVDAPELVVMVAKLTGTLWVADPQMRVLGMAGTLTTAALLDPMTMSLAGVTGPTTGFTGAVRLPFVTERDGRHRKPRRAEQAHYLADNGKPVRVQRDELSLGLPTARFELNFDAR